MKFFYLTLLCFSLCTLGAKAQAPHPDFIDASSWGGADFDEGLDITTDMDGNVITVGYYEGTVDFDPGTGVTNFTSANDADIFIQKMDSAGNFQWAVALSGADDDDHATGVATDTNGNIYVVGFFEGTIDFDPGISTFNQSSSGSADIFVLALDSSGNFLWANSYGSSSSDRGLGIAVGDGGVYVTGWFRNTIDFDLGPGTTNLTSQASSDAFILRLDLFGDLIWARSLESTGISIGNVINVDANGNVYTGGYFTNTIDFDPGSGVQNVQTDFFINDGFLVKLDSNGSFEWEHVIGDPLTFTNIGQQDVRGIAIAPNGNVNICGGFGTSNVDFDYGPGSAIVNSFGSQDAYIQQLTPSGDHVWVKTFGGTSLDTGDDLVTDDNGIIHVVGNFRNTVDFGFSNSGSRTSAGNSDWFLITFDSTGNELSLATAGDSDIDIGSGVAIDAFDHCYVTGAFSGTVDFDPGTGTFSLTATDADVFVQKFEHETCFATFSTDVQSSCSGSFTWIDGITYTSSNNTATDTLVNAAGCDSIVTLNLTLGTANTGTDVVNACDAYTWINGVTYTASNNTATDTLTNVSGCDSVVTLNLTILNSNTGTDLVSACDSYTWIDGMTYTSSNNTATHTLTNTAGCDSVVTLNLTILNSNTGTDVVSACDSYTWIDGITYTSSNSTATETLVNAAGCDSIVTLDLTILNSTTFTDVITACDTYTWIDGITYTSSNNTATDTLVNAAGCDSVVTLDLTILISTSFTDVITACDSYTWINGITYTASNSTATDTLVNAAGCDSIVTLDLTILNSTTGTDVITACDSYTWIDGITYTSSNNTAIDTLVNVAGCDSIVTLDLTILNSTAGTDVITACDSYTWIDGITYTSSNNTAIDTLVNAAGCDSIVTLDLTILNSTAFTDVITACNSYTWIDGVTYTSSNNSATDTLMNAAGCDSIVTLDLTILNSTAFIDVITACDSYTWIDGMTYTSSNSTAVVTLINAAGCDSIVTLDLTINTVDPSVMVDGFTISAVAMNAEYQWFDCATMLPLDGEINQSLDVSANGDYAVEVTENGCTDTSECVTIVGVGISDANWGSNITMYPNPTRNSVTIELGAVQARVSLHNLAGQEIVAPQLQQPGQTVLSLDELGAGVYLVKVQSEDQQQVMRLIKQ